VDVDGGNHGHWCTRNAAVDKNSCLWGAYHSPS
jgi:hypothetical protein